jgi:hypothetical protein
MVSLINSIEKQCNIGNDRRGGNQPIYPELCFTPQRRHRSIHNACINQNAYCSYIHKHKQEASQPNEAMHVPGKGLISSGFNILLPYFVQAAPVVTCRDISRKIPKLDLPAFLSQTVPRPTRKIQWKRQETGASGARWATRSHPAPS